MSAGELDVHSEAYAFGVTGMKRPGRKLLRKAGPTTGGAMPLSDSDTSAKGRTTTADPKPAPGSLTCRHWPGPAASG